MTSDILALAEDCRDRAEQLIDDKWAELIVKKHGSNKPEHFQTEDVWKLREQAKMLEVISKHGMKAHKYFPGVGQRHDVELSTALDWFAANGFVVKDKNGGIVGKVATANMDSPELAELRRSQMKLVESDAGSDDE